MILDIDIRVSNDNGIQVHQFTKHFDSRFEGRSNINASDNSITKSFEEFLAEFLSSSGRVIRNQLITGQTAASNAVQTSSDCFSNIEYTLKLGDSQSVSGKIPLDKLFRLSELSRISTQSDDASPIKNTSSAYENTYEEALESANSPSNTSSDEALVLKRNHFKETIALSEVDEMFRQLISTAVTRYEDSFYIHNIEDSNFAELS
ncbi:hypothetical protein [Lachnotalea glycerini]|uniref:Uncharacterized protein n=1 Tax=Lachnotalea glycerini TaxID=1763509 RepID=A0A371JDD8_9FIRM|nr:hypothetical protein [Lachnotalea glycerini]RDY30753.1 hypothetical protein CG710_013155 [Lachnotalea glycerini]